jgi:hypothetical protein
VPAAVRAAATLRHEGFLRHRRFRWAKVAAVVSAVLLVIYLADHPLPRRSGGSVYGYATGTLGLLLIVWLALLGVRKRWITQGRWSLKAWTSAHVYLGLALLVVGTLHSAFDFGWNVHTLAWALMLAVIASGAVGIGLYVGLPRLLSDNRGELTEPQMIATLAALDRQLAAAALPLPPAAAETVRAALAETPFQAGAGARLRDRFRHPASDALDGDPAIAAALGPLVPRRAALVRQIERHMHLKALLEVWLYLHIPLTFALLAALAAHVVAVFFYW